MQHAQRVQQRPAPKPGLRDRSARERSPSGSRGPSNFIMAWITTSSCSTAHTAQRTQRSKQAGAHGRFVTLMVRRAPSAEALLCQALA